MARQGNYVQVSGANNWAAPLTSALTDISKRASERERTSILDARAAEELEMRKKAQQESNAIARDGLELRRQGQAQSNAIAQENLDMRKRDYEFTEGARRAAQDISRFTNDPNNVNRKFTLNDYASEQKEVFEKSLNQIAQEEAATKQYLSNISKEGINPELFSNATNAYKKRLLESGVDPAKANELLVERGTRLQALTEELASIEDPTKRQDLVSKRLSELYTPQRDRINEVIASGQAMTRREQARAYASDLSPEAQKYFTLDEISAKLGNMISAPSREDLLASEQMRVANINEAQKIKIDGLKDYYRAIGTNKSGGSTGVSRSNSGVAAAIDRIAELNIGKFDNQKAKDMLARMLEADPNLDPQVAAATIAFSIDKGILDNSLAGVDSKEFAEIQQLATTFSGTSSSRGGSSNRPSLAEFSYTPEQAKDITDLLRSRVPSLNNFDTRLPINRNFDPRRVRENLPVPANSVNNAPPMISRDIPVDPLAPYNPFNLDLSSQKTEENKEKRNRAEQYRQSAELASQLKENFGTGSYGSAINSNTILVLPFDEKGEPRPWDQVVSEINNRDEILRVDKVTQQEAEAAANNPALQKEILERTNNIIGGAIKSKNALGGLTQSVKENFNGFLRGTSDSISEFFGGYDPVSYRQREARREAADTENASKTDLRELLTSYINNQQGQPNIQENRIQQFIDGVGTVRDNSPFTDNATTATKTLATMVPIVKGGTAVYKGYQVINNTRQKLLPLMARSGRSRLPQAVNTTGQSRAAQTTVRNAEQMFDRKMEVPAFTRAQEQAYREVLRKGSNFNPPRP